MISWRLRWTYLSEKRGYEEIFTYVRADNPAALAAYLMQSFRILGTAFRHAKLNGRHVDEILIEKLLGPGNEHDR